MSFPRTRIRQTFGKTTTLYIIIECVCMYITIILINAVSSSQIRDGPFWFSPVIYTASGQSIPAVQMTSGNVAHVTFYSGGSIVNKGFNLSWSAVQGSLQYFSNHTRI